MKKLPLCAALLLALTLPSAYASHEGVSQEPEKKPVAEVVKRAAPPVAQQASGTSAPSHGDGGNGVPPRKVGPKKPPEVEIEPVAEAPRK